jgi:glycolate oxidase FAD binding subunit
MASTHSDLAPRGVTVAVDGVPLPEIAEPSTPEEIASLLQESAAAGKKIAPIGGGTKLNLGNVPASLDLGLSTLKLNQVHHYEPTDMTLSVQAGARFADVQALLAGRGQTLPIESADDDRATIGGLIATAFAGPRRLGSGTLRDLLIGIAVAYPSGSVGKAGGLVVKNVTGFDLMRLHLGALGTLGIIVSANFKVLPLPRTETTLVSEPSELSAAFALASTARTGRLRPVSVEIYGSGSTWQTAVRLEGREETVKLGVSALKSAAGWSQELAAEQSRAFWREYVDRHTLMTPDVLIRCGAEPKSTRAMADGLLSALGSSARVVSISPGLGTAIVGLDSATLDAVGLASLRDRLVAVASNVTILTAPSHLKAGIDVWGKTPETISVMRALKSEFDPANVLNPGRFVDRL